MAGGKGPLSSHFFVCFFCIACSQVKGWEGKVSLCDLGYCSAGIDEGWEGCGKGVDKTQHYLNGTPATN